MADDEKVEHVLDRAQSELSDGEVIALRTTDTDEKSIDEYRKVFVLGPLPAKPDEEHGFAHDANKAATREFAIQNGLHPNGEVEHVSTEKHADVKGAWVLTYSLPVIPAERDDRGVIPGVLEPGEAAPNTTEAKKRSGKKASAK